MNTTTSYLAAIRPSSPLAALADFTCDDDTGDGAVSDRRDYCLSQRDAWIAVARRIARRAELHNTPRGNRAYRSAIARAGAWARLAGLSRKPEVSATERRTLAELEHESIRMDSWWSDYRAFGSCR